MQNQRVVIKKYENRRLYDTSNSRYVNLDDIAQMVREGVDVQVVDAVNGEDLTRLVLTQIIVESAKAPDSAFPLDMLRQMVMASGQASREGLTSYMKTMLDMYQNTYRALSPGLNPFDFLQSKPGSAPPATGSAEAPPRPPETSGAPSVEELRRRIEELERQVAKTTASSRTKNIRSKPRS